MPMSCRQTPSCRLTSTLRMGLLPLVLASLGAPAHAQVNLSFQNLNIQQLQPSPGPGSGFGQVSSVETPGHLGSSFGLLVHYDHRPLSLANTSAETSADILTHQLVTDVMAGIGLGESAQLGIAVPILLDQTPGNSAQLELPELQARALGDIRLVGRARLLSASSALGLGVEAQLSLPTGPSTDLFGWGTFSLEPRILAEYRPGPRLRFGLNVGAALLRHGQVTATTQLEEVTLLEIQQELTWGVGTDVSLVPERLSLIGEAFGRVSTGAYLSYPTEVMLGLRASPLSRHWISLGGGAGLSSGYGTPMFRVLLGYSCTPDTRAPQDADGDGLLDAKDSCPAQAEDADRFQDEDGCPELDNDQDLILDTADTCPLESEDKDDFQDADGCPEPDNDQDGVLDAQDRCPDSLEDIDRFSDEDGCLDPDNDQDGIKDVDDRCPDKAEDKDGLADEDGCPEDDADKDGVADTSDRCPTRPETINGNKDEDGCPDAGVVKVVLTRDRVEILEAIYFDVNKDIIQKRSYPLLLQVAQILRGHPELTLIQIEGHTDDQGDDTLNTHLSQRRAEAVQRFLGRAGTDPARLRAIGYGETRPIANNKIPAGRARNRRVVFTILELDGKPLVPPPTGPQPGEGKP